MASTDSVEKRKTYKRKPTFRTKRAFDILMVDGGSAKSVLKKVGYSDSIAKNPQKVIESKSWQMLMDEFMPESLVAERHLALLNKREKIVLMNKGRTYIEDTGQPHSDAKGAIDMAYKLRRKYGDVNIGSAIVLNITGAAASKYGVAGVIAPDMSPAAQNASVERVQTKDDPSIK